MATDDLGAAERVDDGHAGHLAHAGDYIRRQRGQEVGKEIPARGPKKVKKKRKKKKESKQGGFGKTERRHWRPSEQLID